MQWFKSLFTPKAPVTPKATPIPAAVDFEVPRYPPFMKGLPSIEPERLLAQHPEILANFSDIIGGDYQVTRNDELYYVPKGAKVKLLQWVFT